MKKNFTKTIEITPSFDKQNPPTNKDYGIHGNSKFLLKGKKVSDHVHI